MSFDMNTVPVLKRIVVERHAEHLLLEAGNALGMTFAPPIDVELIADNHLDLNIVYEDLFLKYGDSSLLGGLFIPDRKIVAHDGLPQGRRNFTLGHEVGHWMLHRHLIQGNDPDQGTLLDLIDTIEMKNVPPTLCRTNDKAWGERQADWFAAALIMPAKAVRNAFSRNFSHPVVIRKDILESFRDDYWGDESPSKPELTEERWQVLEIVDQVLEAGNFSNVSKEALRVRLETLRLIISEARQARML